MSEPLDEETAIMAFKAILAQLADDIARQNAICIWDRVRLVSARTQRYWADREGLVL